MIVIGQNVFAIQYKTSPEVESQILTLGTLYNPGFVPDIAVCGLALSQIAGTLLEGVEKKENWPPMVVSMDFCQIKDAKTPYGKDLFLAITPEVNGFPKNISVKNGSVFSLQEKDAIHEVAKAAFNMKRLSLARIGRFDDRNVSSYDFAQKYIEEADAIKKFPDLYVPGFGEDLVIEKLRQTMDGKRVGIVNLAKAKERGGKNHQLFPGHFPECPIIPLAGITQSVFLIAEKYYQEITGQRPEHFSIDELGSITPHAPISPLDCLILKVEKISEENETICFRALCFYTDKSGQLLPAITFEKIGVASTQRFEQIWENKQVIRAFSKQAEILQEAYRENHLQIFEKFIRQSLEQLPPEQDELHVLDVGTGAVANIPIAVLKAVVSSRKRLKEFSMVLSDVKQDILEEAAQVLGKYLQEKASYPLGAQHVYLRTASQINGSIHVLPESEKQFDLVTGNFVFDYAENINVEFQRLYEMVKPGGEIVLGFIKKHPPYYLLLPQVLEAMEAQQWKNYNQALIMSEVGRLLARFSTLRQSRLAHYHDPEEIVSALEQNGFYIETLEEETYAGNGFIVRARRL